MLSEMTASQFGYWRVAMDLGAFDTVAAKDHRAGVVAATVANTAGKVLKKGTPALKSRDFIPSRIPERPLTAKEEQAKIHAMFSAIAGKRRRKNG